MTGHGDSSPRQLALSLDAVEERISRRARRVRITLRPDGAVVLTIPQRASRHAAYRFLEESRPWIERQRARRPARSRPAPLRWDGRDRLPWRGADIAVEVVPTVSGRALARLDAGALQLHVPASWRAQPQRLRRLLIAALKAEAERDARNLLDRESARLGFCYRALSLRDPHSRWGSCGADGRIMLSWRLVLAPPDVFRYVVIHELCHLRWRGHGPRFWGLVARQMPGFAAQRDWLRHHGDELLALAL